MTLPAIIDIPKINLLDKNNKPANPVSVRELTYTIYEQFFETVLDKLASGESLKQILKDDCRNIQQGLLVSWIMRDKERKQRYYEAQEIGSEIIADELIDIADAKDDELEDVNRSQLRINTRKWLLEVRSKKRYGDSKKLEIETKKVDDDYLVKLQQRMLDLQKGTDGVYDVVEG